MKENEKRFEIGQRVIYVGDIFKNEIGTIKAIKGNVCDIIRYGVEFDNYLNGHSGNWGGKDGHCFWFQARLIEAIEDEPIEKEVEHIIEEQEAEEIKQARELTQEEREAIEKAKEIIKSIDFGAIAKVFVKLAEATAQACVVVAKEVTKALEESKKQEQE